MNTAQKQLFKALSLFMTPERHEEWMKKLNLTPEELESVPYIQQDTRGLKTRPYLKMKGIIK